MSKILNGVTTYFIYNGHMLIGEYNEKVEPIKEYLYLNSTPIAILADNKTYKIYSDHLDTPRRVANNSTNIIWSWNSKPFGDTMADEDVDSDNQKFVMNLRFPGQYFDSESGTHYNINRDYNPVTGRYIQSDPIGFDGGVNGFGYVNGMPLSNFDLLGLLQRDNLGKLKFIKRGKPRTMTHVAGYMTLVQNGYLITDSGTGVLAYKNLYPTRVPQLTTNCHGFIFAEGKYWIDDPSGIITGDHYRKTDTPKVNNIVIYNGRVNYEHSTRVVNVNTRTVQHGWWIFSWTTTEYDVRVKGLGGIETNAHQSLVEDAWAPSASHTFYSR